MSGIKFYTTARVVDQRKLRLSTRMVDGQPVSDFEDLGWFLWMDGSGEALHVGYEKPSFGPGAELTVIIRESTEEEKADRRRRKP